MVDFKENLKYTVLLDMDETLVHCEEKVDYKNNIDNNYKDSNNGSINNNINKPCDGTIKLLDGTEMIYFIGI